MQHKSAFSRKNSYKHYICDVCYKDTDASQKTPEMYRSIADLLEKTYLSILSLFLRLSLLFSLSIFLSIHSLFCSLIKISLLSFTCNVCDTNLHSHEKDSFKQYICDVCYKYIDASQKKNF